MVTALVGSYNERKMSKQVWGLNKGEIKEVNSKSEQIRSDYRKRLTLRQDK